MAAKYPNELSIQEDCQRPSTLLRHQLLLSFGALKKKMSAIRKL